MMLFACFHTTLAFLGIPSRTFGPAGHFALKSSFTGLHFWPDQRHVAVGGVQIFTTESPTHLTQLGKCSKTVKEVPPPRALTNQIFPVEPTKVLSGLASLMLEYIVKVYILTYKGLLEGTFPFVNDKIFCKPPIHAQLTMCVLAEGP